MRFLTAGESHGRGLVGIFEGMPAGLEITNEYIHAELKRRKLGYGRGARMKIEDEAVEIVTGVRHGYSIGAPICLLIWNKDWPTWQEIMASGKPAKGKKTVRGGSTNLREVIVPRPGHADLIGGVKYHHDDMRNVLERSSARETAMRVALGTLARRFLEELGIHVGSRVTRIGAVEDSEEMTVAVKKLNETVDSSPMRCLGKKAEKAMIAAVDQAKKEGNTLGGFIEVHASGIPIGLGSYAQWDRRIEGEIGKAFLSLNAIKGVEVGLGFELGRRPGTEVHDEFFAIAPSKSKRAGVRVNKKTHIRYRTNRSGGIDGGMTTGQAIVVRAAMKPLATLMKPLKSVNVKTGEGIPAHVERSDVCAVPAAAVIGESLLALTLAQFIIEKFGGDSMSEVLPRVEAWNEATRY
jgi:chorismate synthase